MGGAQRATHIYQLDPDKTLIPLWGQGQIQVQKFPGLPEVNLTWQDSNGETAVIVDPRTGDRVPAGRLIDTAGLKGTTIGGATVSTQHANFIVTDASATATHVRELMDLVRERVAGESGIVLEDEVVIWERERGPGP